MEKDLLDEMAEKLKCNYISDLRYVDRKSDSFEKCINEIEHSVYSVKQWAKTVSYIIGCCTLPFSNENEAREYLLNAPK